VYLHYLSDESCFFKLVFSLLGQGSEEAHNALFLAQCLDALCAIAVAEPFTEYLVPQILSFITEKCEADECSAGIRSLR
jgi:hypothetical protein